MRDQSSSSSPGFISVRKSEHDREIRVKQMNGAHIMQRPATWKVVTVDAAMARLYSIFGLPRRRSGIYSGFESLHQQHMVGANILRF